VAVPAGAAFPGPVLLARERIAARVAELGRAIGADYGSSDPVLVTLLKGATIFLADLSRAVGVPHRLDFMAISAYRGATRDSGSRIRILKDLDRPVRDQPVLIVEDVVDTGLTLNYLLKALRLKGPSSVEICTLLDRPQRRLIDLPLRYTGFPAPDGYVVGYGFDHRQRWRNLPDIHLLTLPRAAS
jgi:hypoxanthine phosphoribosyltransferase